MPIFGLRWDRPLGPAPASPDLGQRGRPPAGGQFADGGGHDLLASEPRRCGSRACLLAQSARANRGRVSLHVLLPGGEESRGKEALAVLRLTTSSNSVGCSMGRSADFAPFRSLSTKAAARRKPAARFGPYDIRAPTSTNAPLANTPGRRFFNVAGPARAHPIRADHLVRDGASTAGPQAFFCSTSWSICLSNVRSATTASPGDSHPRVAARGAARPPRPAYRFFHA